MDAEFQAVIGLEVHCQLATHTKIFCSCRVGAPEGPSGDDELAGSEGRANVHTCPVCAGHPGTLPVLNRKVVEFAVQAGLATNCQINQRNFFARKNYFYPDLPKGYQISQFENPICERGWLNVETSRGPRKISIQRIHMEEDAGKNIHMSGFSLIDLNRAGVPLIEIVSGPDMRTSEEAGAYLRSLHAIVTYLGISDGNMEKGNFRCDANVSVMPKSSTQFGTRTEIKNVNSFRFVEKAIDYEIARQIEVIRSGGRIIQETRSYDSAKNVTHSLRSKEEAQDYRYFPDPDLPPLCIDTSWIEELRSKLPELPETKRTRIMGEFGLSSYDAGVLTSSLSWVQFFEKVVHELAEKGFDVKVTAKPVANWMTGEVVRLLKEDGIELDQSRLTVSHLAELVALILKQVISGTVAKQVLSSVWKTGESVQKVVDREGLAQVSDVGALEPFIDQVIAQHPQQVAEYRAGKEKVMGFFVGQVMKKMGGKANPALLGEVLKKKLSNP